MPTDMTTTLTATEALQALRDYRWTLECHGTFDWSIWIEERRYYVSGPTPLDVIQNAVKAMTSLTPETADVD